MEKSNEQVENYFLDRGGMAANSAERSDCRDIQVKLDPVRGCPYGFLLRFNGPFLGCTADELDGKTLIAAIVRSQKQKDESMKKIEIIALAALVAGALSGCAGGVGVSDRDGLHVGAGIATPFGAAGGGFHVGGPDLIGGAAAVSTPLGGVDGEASIAGKNLIGAGVHADTIIGGAGLDGRVLSRHTLISGKGYVEPVVPSLDD
jgi:hypothetical protein